MYDNNDRNTTSKCTEWQYSDDVGYTIVSEVGYCMSQLARIVI